MDDSRALAAKVVHLEAQIAELQATITRLHKDCNDQRRRADDAQRRLEAVRKDLWPTYQTYMQLFTDLGEKPQAEATGEISEAWGQWLSKAGAVGCKGMLEILIRKGRLKQIQLATLAGVKFGGSTWRAYRSWMTRNHLATLHEDEIEAARL